MYISFFFFFPRVGNPVCVIEVLGCGQPDTIVPTGPSNELHQLYHHDHLLPMVLALHHPFKETLQKLLRLAILTLTGQAYHTVSWATSRRLSFLQLVLLT